MLSNLTAGLITKYDSNHTRIGYPPPKSLVSTAAHLKEMDGPCSLPSAV